MIRETCISELAEIKNSTRVPRNLEEPTCGVSRLIRGIMRVTMRVIGVINLLTKSPDPPSKHQILCSP